MIEWDKKLLLELKNDRMIPEVYTGGVRSRTLFPPAVPKTPDGVVVGF